MIGKFSVKSKLFGLVALLPITGILLGAVIYRSLSPLSESFEAYVDRTNRQSAFVDVIQQEFGYGGAIHSFKNYVLRGTPKHVGRFEEAYVNINAALDSYVALPDVGADERQAIAAIRAVIDKYHEGLAVTREMVSQAAPIADIDKAVKVSDGPAIAGIKLLAERTHQQAEDAKNVFADAVSDAGFVVLSVLAVCLVLVVSVVGFVAAAIVGPLARLVAAFGEISGGDADLTRRLPVKGDDELAQISAGFNQFCERVAATVAQMQAAAGQLSTATGRMNTANTESQTSIERQRVELEQIVTAMNEMTLSFEEVSRHAAEASDSAIEVDGDTETGRRVVASNVEYIHSVANEVERAGTVIAALEKDSDSIGSVLDVIRGIAEQTNLLALNAAIEAARAGDQGRGFAVVADEVRTLAQRTQESTEEIQQMIESLQSASSQAVAVMSQGSDKVKASVTEAEKVRETLEKIATGVNVMRNLNTQIATSAGQQNSVARDMDQKLTNVAGMMEQTAASAANAAAVGTELDGLAGQMAEQVRVYRT